MKRITSISQLKPGNKIFTVNHDPHAIASHLANHPECTHFTEDIRTLDVSPIVDLVKKVRTQKDWQPMSSLCLRNYDVV